MGKTFRREKKFPSRAPTLNNHRDYPDYSDYNEYDEDGYPYDDEEEYVKYCETIHSKKQGMGRHQDKSSPKKD